jgi:hypothetical protein
MTVTVSNTGSAFSVTSFNTTTFWAGNSSQTVNWNVAGTAGNPAFNAANVRITLSTDGGLTYPITLVASTPNDGSESFTVPNVSTTQARIRVQPVNNIFFDINNVNIGITAVATPPSTPVLLPSSDTGVSSSDNVTRDNTPTFTGTAPAGATVTLRANGTPVGSIIADGSGNWSITSSVLADATYTFTATANTSAPSAASTPLLIDTASPLATFGGLQFETGQAVAFVVNESLGGTFAGSLVEVTNLSTSQTFSVPAIGVTFDEPSLNGSVNLSLSGSLPDGNYLVGILPGATDVAGNSVSVTGNQFFILAGDANRDRSVDISDFAVLVANFNRIGTVFSEADFDYSGITDIGDFALLVSRYNAGIPAPGEVPARALPALRGAGMPAGSVVVAPGTRLASPFNTRLIEDVLGGV